jgi:hypothetical protein
MFNINYNNFGALGYGIECYKCNNFEHIARSYRSDLIVSSMKTKHISFSHIREQQRTCKRKKEYLKGEECGFVLQAKNRRTHWYIDNG